MVDTDVKVVVTGILYDENNNIKQKFVKHNLITKAGFDFISNSLGNIVRPAPIQYVAVGTNNTAPSVNDTKLKAMVSKKSCSYYHAVGTTTLTFSATFIAGEATDSLQEAGILTGDDILFDRVTYPAINKGALDTYVMTFELTLKEGTVV